MKYRIKEVQVSQTLKFYYPQRKYKFWPFWLNFRLSGFDNIFPMSLFIPPIRSLNESEAKSLILKDKEERAIAKFKPVTTIKEV